jgi:hypothetical protein
VLIHCMERFFILAHDVKFINSYHFNEVYDLSHQGWCPKCLKVLKDFEECEVEAFFGSIVNKNRYKYT